MKAIVYTQYGSPDVLQFKEVEKPTPREDEVLIKVHAADWHYLRGVPFLFRQDIGFQKPKNSFLGADLAARVETVGKNVTRFQPGDEVFGDLSESGGVACGAGGARGYSKFAGKERRNTICL